VREGGREGVYDFVMREKWWSWRRRRGRREGGREGGRDGWMMMCKRTKIRWGGKEQKDGGEEVKEEEEGEGREG